MHGYVIKHLPMTICSCVTYKQLKEVEVDMKKITVLIVVIAVVTFSFSAVSGDAGTILKNGDFEADTTDPWKSFAIFGKPATVTLDEKKAFKGENSVRISATTDKPVGLTQAVTCAGIDCITLIAWVVTNGSAWLEVVQMNDGKPISRPPFPQSEHITENDQWEKLSLNLDIDDKTDELRIHLLCKQGTTWFDNASLEAVISDDITPFKEAIDPTLAELGTKLHLSIVCHVEPIRSYNNTEYLRNKLKGLDDFTSMLEEYGAKLTLQVQPPFTSKLIEIGENPLYDLELRGHEVCTHYHENVYVENDAPYQERVSALADVKAEVDSFGVSNLTLCGGWQQEDIVKVAGEVGYRYLDNYKYAPTQMGSEVGLTVNPYRPSLDDIESVDVDGPCLYLSEGPWDMVEKLASIKHNATPEMFDSLTQMINRALPMLELGRVNCANVVMHLNDFGPMNVDNHELYGQYFEQVLAPHAESGLIEFATISEVGKLYEETEERGVSMLPQVAVIVNENYFQDADEASQAVSNLRKQAELCDWYDLNAEHYFTWFAWEQTLELDHGYLNWVSDNNHINVHCHGANRNPPRPSLISRMKGENWDRDCSLAYEFQTHDVDIINGKILDEPGGVKEIYSMAGSDMVSCGRTVHSAILKANRDIGFEMAVGLGDNSGAPDNRCFMMNMLGRPDDIFIHPNDEFIPWVKGNHDLKSSIMEEIRELSYFEPRYLLFVIHDWDMFRHVNPDSAWDHYEEVLRWLTEDIGCEGVSLAEIYSHSNHLNSHESRWLDLACKMLIEDVNANEKLSCYYGATDHELTLAEMLQGCLSDGDFLVSDLIGPTEIFEDEQSLGVNSAGIADYIYMLNVEMASWDSVPASFVVDEKTLSAGQLLYLLCVYKTESVSGDVLVPAISNYPNVEKPPRFELDRLQFWSCKPAHFSW